MSLISQRPQSVNKDVLNQVELLIVLQLVAAQERKAISEWMAANSVEAAAAIEELPSLPIGTAYAWSPQWLKFFGKIHISAKNTYDASSTPTFETEALPPPTLDEATLAMLRAALAVEPASTTETDDGALQRRIQRLERELAQHKQVRPQVEQVEVPVIRPEQIHELRTLAEQLLATGQLLTTTADTLASALARVTSAPAPTPANLRTVLATSPASASAAVVATPGDARERSAPQQRMLDAFAALEALGIEAVDKQHVAVLSGQSPRSSAFTNHLSALRATGAIAYPQPGQVSLTPPGRAQARPIQQPATLQALHAAWYDKLPAPQARMLGTLIAQYPSPLTKEVLATATAQSPRSSAFTNHLSEMRSLGLISYPRAGLVAATALLFPRGLADHEAPASLMQ